MTYRDVPHECDGREVTRRLYDARAWEPSPRSMGALVEVLATDLARLISPSVSIRDMVVVVVDAIFGMAGEEPVIFARMLDAWRTLPEDAVANDAGKPRRLAEEVIMMDLAHGDPEEGIEHFGVEHMDAAFAPPRPVSLVPRG